MTRISIGLTSHDAAQLEIAQQRGLPLVTLDKVLREAAKAEGVAQLPDGNL